MKYLDPKADLTFKKIFGNHPKRLSPLEKVIFDNFFKCNHLIIK